MHNSIFSPDRVRLTWRDFLSAVLLPCLILSLAVLGLGLYGYGTTRNIIYKNAASDLRAIARLKTSQIEHWLTDQSDIAHMMAAPDFLHDLQTWLAGGQRDESLKQRLIDHLSISDTLAEPRSIALRDSAGELLLAAGTMADSPAAQRLARQAASSGKIVFEPLHFANAPAVQGRARPPIETGYFIPLRGTEDNLDLDRNSTATATVIHMRTRPEYRLYPLLQIWPGSSPSAETILLHRAGEHVIYLNPLRHLPNSALHTQRPLADNALIGSQALIRGEGFFEGNDYRGIASLAYVLPVAGTPWMLAAKIDRTEVLHDLRILIGSMALLCCLLLAACAYWLTRHKQRELHLNHLLAEYDDLYQNAPCGYHSLDKNGIIRRINQTELNMLGYQREEVIGKMNVRQILTPASLRIFQHNFPRQIGGKEIQDLELEMIRKDGSILPVLINASSIRDRKGNFLMSRTTINDLSTRKAIEAQLLESREQLHELARHNDSIRETERKHMARELHDEFGQMLTLLKMHISLLQVQFDTLPDLVDKTEEMRVLVERIISMIRNMTSNLRPAALDLGIAGALEWLAADFARNTGLTCNYSGPDQEPRLDEPTATAIFRIAQESLTNVARHADASRVNIRLNQDHGILRLTVNDNGRGFDVNQVAAGRKNFGLLGMQERISMLDGRFHLSSTPGQGTRIDIELPLTVSTPSTPPGFPAHSVHPAHSAHPEHSVSP
ncbi:exported protein of unknown function [Sterolibacterium denitrificans]|uniref:Histidine kinase n=1 Tax=Sterolibacterium denitrificans TaxID=157592 RepID=A0A7Z7HS86_9PROT|nr:PAS domain S-box protein [Sterolibacterium denitrificans]SMB29382.1 exported protein of unknown function [Sterolibacterium denitrificans]